jgi:hypothetical protein
MNASYSNRGSRRAAVGAGKGRDGHGQTVKEHGREPPGIPLLSWAFTTIRHDLLPSALTRGSGGTDRGRQSADPRSPGGLVGQDQRECSARRSRSLFLPLDGAGRLIS